MDGLVPSRQVVALKGGLGNQLFQFAYALFLSRQNSRVRLDLSCVRHGTPQIFDVPGIGVRARQMALSTTRFIPSPSGRLPIVGKLSRKVMRPGRIVLNDSPQGPAPISDAPPAWWFGYWQRLSYAQTVIPLLRTSLASTMPSMSNGQGRTAVARVHVRRGDYAGNPMELPAEWYRRAIDMVYVLAGDVVVIEVVTNDPEWCKQNLDLGRTYTILPTRTALEDMGSLATSDFLVISRSTFSWWGAAVSNATVIAPDPWLPERSSGNNHDFIPEAWLPCTT